VYNLANDRGNNNLRLIKEEGVLEGLARVIKKNAKTFMKARKYAIGALIDMTYCGIAQLMRVNNFRSIAKKTSEYNFPGLMAAVVRAVGREGEDHKKEREKALELISNVANSNDTLRRGVFELEGLMENVGKALEKEGYEHKVEREEAVNVIFHISGSEEAEVEKGLFEYDGVMKGLVRSMRDGDIPASWREKRKGSVETLARFLSSGNNISLENRLARVEQALSEMAKFFSSMSSNFPDVVDLVNQPSSVTSPTTNGKRSNLALLAENQAVNDRAIKKIKKEKDDVSKERDDLQQQLHETEQAHDEATSCSICYNSTRSAAFLPCSHLACCKDCSTEVNECPLCRTTITQRMDVFM